MPLPSFRNSRWFKFFDYQPVRFFVGQVAHHPVDADHEFVLKSSNGKQVDR